MPKMTLSHQALLLLKHTLTTTGEKEIDLKGNEVPSPLRLNGEEQAQRRFFFKAVNEKLDKNAEDSQKEIKPIQDKLDEMVKTAKKENPLKEGESTENYDKRINEVLITTKPKVLEMIKERNEALVKYNNAKIEFEINDKTLEVVKKYFNEFSNNTKWTVGDDELVLEIEETLK
jgi:Skp family chaperone for outer membrane proteins